MASDEWKKTLRPPQISRKEINNVTGFDWLVCAFGISVFALTVREEPF